MLPSSRAIAQRANAELPPLAADDPWRRQIAATHEALAAKGLPTSAPDVHVVVVEAGALETAGGGPPRVSSHASAVVRTIGALAPGADTELLSARPPPSSSDLAGTLRASPSHIADLRAHEMLSERVRQGDVSFPALLTSPAGSRLDQEARRLIDDPAVHAQLRERYVAHPPRMENLSPAERAGMAHISDPTMRAVLDHLKSADGQETLDSAKARFAATVSAARDRVADRAADARRGFQRRGPPVRVGLRRE